ncbi:MAG: Ig-like domain-containing protein [Oceanospirillaceae bacterium]
MPYVSHGCTKNKPYQGRYILLASLIALMSFGAFAVTPSDQGFDAEAPRYMTNAGDTITGARYTLIAPTAGAGAKLGLFSESSSISITPSPSDNAVMFNFDGATVIAGALDARITSADGSEFRIVSMEVDTGAGLGTSSSLMVTGYRNGASVASDSISTGTTDASGSVAYTKNGIGGGFGGTLVFNTDWQNIDEIRFTGTSTIVAVDDLDFEAAVAATPTITSATYNVATSSLVVTGSNFTATSGALNDVVANKFTFTGEGGSTYTLTDTADVEISSASGFTLSLSATDSAAINVISNKNGTSSTGATTYNLAGSAGFIADSPATDDITANGITVSNVAVPTISSATYDASSGVLTVVGSGFTKRAGADNDIIANKFTLYGEGGASYTLTDTSNVEITSNTSLSFTLSATDKAAYNLIANKNGGVSSDISTYRLDAAEDWAAGADPAINVEDSSGNNISVSNVAVPAITSATYDYTSGVLVVTGSGYLSRQGAANDVVANTFTFTGEGGGTYSLTDTANVEVTSGSSFTFTLSATDKSSVNILLNQNGLTSVDATTYNLAAADDWAAGADAAINVADLTGNGITASNVLTIPGAPIIGTATAGNTQVSVTFSAPGSNGGSAITGYTATASPGGLTASGAASPLVVTGLTNGTAYSFSVTATNGVGTGSASSASNSVTPQAAQTISFTNPGSQSFGTTPTLTASASSSLTPSFTSSTPGVCTITSGGLLTFITTGSCTINADQAGNSSYLAAAQVSQSFSVTAVVAGAPTIGTATAGDTQASVSFSAPASTGGAAITSYTVTSSPDGLTVSGVASPLTVTGLTNGTAYSFSVTATNSAGASAVSSASNSVTPMGSQTISFANPGAQSFGTAPTLTASASSSLTPSFTSSTTGVCTITSGGALSFVTTGTCTINADQAGNGSYLAAAQVSQSFSVTAVVAGAPTIGTAIAGDTQASVSFSVPASNGGAAISAYTVTSNPGGLTASGAASPLTVTGLTNGTAYSFSVTATNSAGASAVSSASNSVTPIGSQTITFANPGAQSFGTTPTLTASVSSGLNPSFTSSTIGVCTISSAGVLTFITTGSCTININQAGNASYTAAAEVSQTFAVNAAVAGVPSIGTAVAGDTQATVSFTPPTNNGGATITGYTVTSSPGGLTASGAGSPLTVLGLTNGTAYTFSVTAKSSAGISAASSASNSVTPNGAPVINSSPILKVDQGASYSYTLTALDTVGDTLTYSALNIPIWLSFDTATGNLSGVPSKDNIGSHAIELKVTDAAGLFATQAFTLEVNATNRAPVASNTSVTLDEDGSLSISFSATDPENDVLSFEVLTQPTSGKLDKHGSVWLYTPEADFNGDDSVSFIAKDAELSSQPGLVSIKVNPINDKPQAVDDSYSQSASADSGYTIAVLDNDTDVDGDTLTIDGAAADVGSVQIVASQLKYQAPTDFVGPVTLRYTISDGQKGRSNAKVQLIITGESSADAPVITVPADITANATGLFTKLKLGVATAVDKAGNKLAVSLVNTQQLFAPGEHLAYWKTTDSQGLSSIKSQKVTVNPLISISRNQLVAEGGEVQLSMFLNGSSAQYPVSIPYTVSGSSDVNDHDLVDGVFTIESGLSASFSINIFDDGIAEVDEELIINLDPSMNISRQSETRLIITEANIAPQASIQVTQSNELRSQVSKLDGKVYLKARTRDANVQDNLSEVWSTDTLILESDDIGSYFDPSGLDEGNYPISVVVTDDGTPQLSTTVQLTLLVKAALPILTGDDFDGDLIPDDHEGFADTDSDGIADYLDAINECNVLQEQGNEQSLFLAESQSGVCLRLGKTALLTGSDGIEVQEDNLIDDLQADNLGGLFDFELTDLPKQGDSVIIVIPQKLPVPTNAVYRKFVRGSWQDFVSNASNEVMSTAGNSGYCPPPGAAEWQPGLIEGHWCVQLTIEDGGPNDDDGIANGTIVDPGGVAVMLNDNALPLAVADAVTVPVNQGIEIDVLANDSDADGDTLTVKQVISQFGTAEVLDNQQISYLPAEDFIGTDVLVYSISDGNGGTGSSKLTVTVVANRAPIAVDDMANTDDKTTLILDVLSNDTDADNQTLSVIAVSAQQGGVMIENNKIRYTPITGFEGIDTVSYTISDGVGGEATANVMVTVKAYQAQVIENESSGGSMHWLWSGLLLLVIMLRIKPESGFRYYKVLSLGLVVLLTSSSHIQAQESSSVSPWYLDAVVGFSETVNTQAELQREITTGQIEAFDKSDTSFGFSLGYQVNSILAFEFGYIDFGEGSTQIRGESLDTGQYHELLKSVSPILPTGFSVGAEFSLVEHDGWRFSVPVGVLVWESEVKSDSQGQTLTTQFDGIDWYTGMHLDYQFTRNWSAGLGIDYIALAPNDILSYQLNLRYQF